MNEPLFHDGGYKTNKVIKFFLKKQVNEFIRVKFVIILNSRNVKSRIETSTLIPIVKTRF